MASLDSVSDDEFLTHLVAHLGRSLTPSGTSVSKSTEATEVVLLESFIHRFSHRYSFPPSSQTPQPPPSSSSTSHHHPSSSAQYQSKSQSSLSHSSSSTTLSSHTSKSGKSGKSGKSHKSGKSRDIPPLLPHSPTRGPIPSRKPQPPPSVLADGFQLVFTALLHDRLMRPVWYESVGRDHALTVLQVLRLLLRDKRFVDAFVSSRGVGLLGKKLADTFPEYHADASTPFLAEIVVQLASILKNLASEPDLRPLLIEAQVHSSCVLLLDAPDAVIVQCVLIVLINLALTPAYALLIGRLDSINKLLNIVHNYNRPAQLLAADLLDVLSKQGENCVSIVEAQGLTVLLSLLTSDDLALLESLVIIIGTLAEDQDVCAEIRQMGGVSVILALINPTRVYAPSPSAQILPLYVAVANTLTTMSLEDESAHQIRLRNGVYYLGSILLDPSWLTMASDTGSRPQVGSDVYVMHAYIFQTLRYLFSVERNRKVFKRFFVYQLFGPFVQIEAYTSALEPYFSLVDVYYSLTESELDTLRQNLDAINTNKPPSRYINGYAVLELLGTGSFGSVFLVKKRDGQSTFAMKELDIEGAVDELEEEVSILSQLRHPNIVRYYDSFREGGFLYIIMELCEGATLLEYLESLREKKEKMAEKRIWQIFIQLVLAFKYLHKTAQVVHRDLKPSNIIVDAKNVIKLADFGLAREYKKSKSMMMNSVKGTPGYLCPEIMKGEPYNDKADTWALGCVLYQMATLRPPFEGGNILALGQKIIAGEFDTDVLSSHSPLMTHLVTKLIEPDVSRRLDIIQVSQVIAPLLVDSLSRVTYRYQRLERERKNVERELKELQRNLLKVQRQSGGASGGGGGGEGSSSGVSGLGMKEAVGNGLASESSVSMMTRMGGGPNSSSSSVTMLSISPQRVRVISDPISQMLNQLHKIVYITQLPPTANRDPRRTVVEKYKRALFAGPSASLKTEMQKLLTGSNEEIKLDFGMDWTAPMRRRGSVVGGGEGGDGEEGDGAGGGGDVGVTYAELADMIEKVLAAPP